MPETSVFKRPKWWMLWWTGRQAEEPPTLSRCTPSKTTRHERVFTNWTHYYSLVMHKIELNSWIHLLRVTQNSITASHTATWTSAHLNLVLKSAFVYSCLIKIMSSAVRSKNFPSVTLRESPIAALENALRYRCCIKESEGGEGCRHVVTSFSSHMI